MFLGDEPAENYMAPVHLGPGGIELSDSLKSILEEREEELSLQRSVREVFRLEREPTPYYRHFFCKTGKTRLLLNAIPLPSSVPHLQFLCDLGHVVFIGTDPQLGPLVIVIMTQPDNSGYQWFLLLTQFVSELLLLQKPFFPT